MNNQDDIWTTRLHDAVDDHPNALVFDVPSYVTAGRKRVRRNRAAATLGTVAAAAVLAATIAVVTNGPDGSPQPAPVVPDPRQLEPGTNGWAAVDGYQGGEAIYLVRPGESHHRLEVAGLDPGSDACPAWSPDGARLLFGRVAGSSGAGSGRAELVVVDVGRSGKPGDPTVIGLDGFQMLEGFDPHPCGTWAPDGRWVALAGTGAVWVVDTQTGTIRKLPDLRPSDLEWRPGTDELAIAGDTGTDRGAPTVSTKLTVYSVSTGESQEVDTVEAAHITWSPDGRTLAYTGGETGPSDLRVADADGTDGRVLVADLGDANHGIGPVWSPTGERIVYQRLIAGRGEAHEVVLVDVADGTEEVLEPPVTDDQLWYPDVVTWSPDGTTLLYSAWSEAGPGEPGQVGGGVLSVPADQPGEATLLVAGIGPLPNNYSHRWTPVQMWGRQAE